MMDKSGKGRFREFVFSREGMVLIGFLVVGGYFLWTEHQAHVKLAVPYLPYLLILLCPLMHLFMHRDHDHGGRGSHKGHGGGKDDLQ
jgi:hypothetical protein